MARLEEITVGSLVSGLGQGAVTVVSAKWHGTSVLEVVFKDSTGSLGEQMLYREDESSLGILDKSLPWSFDADANLMRLASEAYRIHLAHLFDPYLAVHTSDVEPLPHQISAVYQEMLKRLPLRYILADDPGAGKTIMTGLFIRELMARGDLKRCLIVAPGNLVEQWQEELFRKFHLRFEILTNDRLESAVTGNVFTELNYCIARLDKLARNEAVQEKLRVTDWDLIVCDEAHKMSATVWGQEISETRRFKLGRLLSGLCRHFLLLTATPHNGKEEDFQLFLSLIDQDRFCGTHRAGAHPINLGDVMRRLVKEDLLKFDAKPLFPERLATTVNYDLSPGEAALYDAVTDYVRAEFNRADNLEGERKSNVGFALTVLQRRLASSPEAIYQSLSRRRARLEDRLAQERLGQRGEEYRPAFSLDDDYDDDDSPSAELEDAEEKVADRATAASTIAELEAEIETLRQLEDMANQVRLSGLDRKWDELSGLLQDNRDMFDAEGMREKLIIFTEHRDTLRYLERKIRSLLGRDEAVVTIYGGLARDERRKAEELFRQDKEVRILVATDAAGEGVNLQRAHLMVNYDLPWNPNRLEQRFGRIHRIGQTEVCHLWNLVARETREGMVFQRLLDKLQQEREALGGKVFDVLGKVTFDNRSLRELLIEAVRYGNDPEVRDKLNRKVDLALDREALEALIREGALTEDIMDVHTVMSIREEMERLEAHKLQPHFIEAFFLEAFRGLGGKIQPREKGRYEITSVPYAVRNLDRRTGFGEPVLGRYERVCFAREYRQTPGQPPAILLCPGHQLLEAVINLILEQNAEVLKRGAVFVDENDPALEARLLFYIEDAVQDGTPLPGGGKRKISQRVHFAEIRADGTAQSAGYAPYLDYRAATEAENAAIRNFLSQQVWLKNGVEDLARGYAIASLIPAHVAEVRSRRERMIEKTIQAVKERLTAEIQYWDYRAADLKQKEATGKINARLNSQLAARRAEELEARMHKRLADLELEKLISALPPVVTGGALVVPLGLLRQLEGVSPPARGEADAQARQSVEQAAMRAVMALEESLGFEPRDVSASKCGYDVESRIPENRREEFEGACLRFIEVKGRTKGAETVTVTRNEILTALNKPENFLLALVEVEGAETNTVYLKNPFREPPDFAAKGVIYSLAELKERAEIVWKK